MNSTFGNRADTDEQTDRLAMCSEDAAAREIVNGDRVRVFNDRGSCLLTADVDGVVNAGVVRAPSVRWGKRAANGQGINALTQEKLTDLGGSPSFYSCLVQVERCGD